MSPVTRSGARNKATVSAAVKKQQKVAAKRKVKTPKSSTQNKHSVAKRLVRNAKTKTKQKPTGRVRTKKGVKNYGNGPLKFECVTVKTEGNTEIIVIPEYPDIEIKVVKRGKHPYECLKCSMGFWTKQAYEEHAPVHVLRKQKPLVKRFRCDICAKEFSKLCDVERHTRVHTGEKPCVCNICNKGFQQSHNLSKHLLTHLHIKPFQCEICNRQFGRNDVLNRHLLTHSIEKPVKCWVCSKGFIRHTQLVVHLLNHHPNHPIEDPNQASAPDEGEEERKTDEEEEEEEADKVRSK